MPNLKPRKPRSSGPAHLQQRVRALRQRLSAWRADAVLLTHARDVRYLTGFVGDDSWALIRAKAGQPIVISDFRFKEQVQREAPHVTLRIRTGGLVDELAQWMDRYQVKRVALQSGQVTLALREALVKKIGAKRLVAVDDGLIQQRAVKDKTEVAAIRKALTIQQEAYRRTVEQIRIGQSEMQIAAYLEYQMRLLGADRPSFPTIVAIDANASLPHAIPGSKKVKSGSMILIDWGARWQGYCSDLTRVMALGRMKPKIKEIYTVVLESQLAAIDAIAPGKALCEIDAVARRVIDEAGYGDRFGHSLGHGIGLNIHEQPTLSSRSKGVLQPGHVVTVEPGIYLPGVGGVRIEDDVLVTARGRSVLSRLPTDVESAII